jgi:TRAP-type C4-dicarboxylate transport system substrate-binding protein
MNRLLPCLLVSLLLVAGSALAAPVQLKIATLAPENSGWMKAMRAGGDEIAARTEGRVKFKFYGGGVMGSDAKVLRKMRIGQLHGAAFTPSALAERYPDINLYGFPLVFRSTDEVAFVRERLDQKLLDGLEEAGLVGFGITTGGFANLMSSQPVQNYDDLKGRKVWVPEGDQVTYAAMKSLDLSPVVLPITDVMTGLQTGLIEVVGTPPVGAVALQWYTKVAYVTDAPLVYTYAVLVVEKKTFDRIDPADQAVVREVMGRIYSHFDRQNLIDNDGALEAMVANGIEVVEPADGALEHWRGRVAELNARLVADGAVTTDLWEELQSLLAEYRDGRGEPVTQARAE